jgi:hypothetical protein
VLGEMSHRAEHEVGVPPSNVVLSDAHSADAPVPQEQVDLPAADPATSRPHSAPMPVEARLSPSVVLGSPGRVTFDDLPPPSGEAPAPRRSLRLARPPATARVRRAVALVAAVVVVAAAGVGVWQLVGDHSPSSNAAPPVTTLAPTRTTTTTTTTAPSVLTPRQTTASLVTYVVSGQRATFRFTATGACWIGVQHSSAAPYLWMDTLQPGGAATFASTLPLVVFVGAPGNLKVEVNGVPLALPAANQTPYHLEFDAE